MRPLMLPPLRDGFGPVFLAGAAWLCAPPVLAATAYVSDQLVITVRAAPRTSAEILKHLRTGDAVEVLGDVEGENFVRVRTEDGVEGWSLRQYLMDSPAARNRVADAEARARTASAELEDARTRLANAEQQLDAAARDLERTRTLSEQQQAELEDIRAASGSALALREQNEALARRLEESERERARLARDNETLADRARRDWFVAGAGVLGAGMVVGWIFSRLLRRKRWEW